MSIGKMRKRIEIQSESRIEDGAGGYAHVWTTFASVWASVVPFSGKEVYSSGRLESRTTHKVTMRWNSDINVLSSMRLLMDSRAFNIRAVINEDEENRRLVLLVEEGGAI